MGRTQTHADSPGALAAAVHEGRIYAAGGVGIDDVTDTFEIYDIEADTWSSGPAMPTAREHLTAAVLDGKFYAIGGRTGNLYSNLRTTEVYDPATNSWEAVTAMPTARSGFGATTLGGVLVVMGGESPNGTNPQVEVYDPAEDAWFALPNLPTPRHGLGVAALGNRIYAAAGGTEPGFFYSDAVEVLTFESASFSRVSRSAETFFCNLPVVSKLLRGSVC
ncbi:Kelch repeat-containing protein [Haladaptatus sp. GCM10025893]|uniref:Kelch repeat-containing protein n=1 Tax=Haladaptatus sp. GCM10025893 TaxID=3252659 RepID=UPI00360F88C0